MQRSEQEHGTEERNADALEHAERTGFETEHPLGVERVGQQGETGYRAREVGAPP
jgi:hypothetical protein